MIELIPAIDIINGQCVRLTKGDYDQIEAYRQRFCTPSCHDGHSIRD